MPTYERFEDLPVGQAAATLYEKADDLLTAARASVSASFRDQLERAALSVSNNIAEGFERGTTNELLASCTSPVAPPVKSAPCSFCFPGGRPFQI